MCITSGGMVLLRASFLSGCLPVAIIVSIELGRCIFRSMELRGKARMPERTWLSCLLILKHLRSLPPARSLAIATTATPPAHSSARSLAHSRFSCAARSPAPDFTPFVRERAMKSARELRTTPAYNMHIICILYAYHMHIICILYAG